MLQEIAKHKDLIVSTVFPERAETPTLRLVNYFISHDCNLRCPYCRVVERNVARMSVSDRAEAFRRIRGVSNERTILSIVGGEPTNDPEFLLAVVGDAIKAGFYVNITTNGFGLNRPLISALSKIEGPDHQYLRQIALSVDAEGPKSNLHRASDTLHKVKDAGIIPVVNTVIGSKTRTPDFKRHANEIIREGFFIVPQIISPEVAGGAFSGATRDQMLTKSQIREVIPYLLWKKYTTGKIPVSLGYLWAVMKLGFSEDGRPGMWHCLPNFRGYRKRGRGYIALDSDGFIGPCQEFPHELNLLNLEPQKLTIAYLDKAFREVTERCAGCFHNCYINEDELRGPRSAAGEVTTALAIAKVIK